METPTPDPAAPAAPPCEPDTDVFRVLDHSGAGCAWVAVTQPVPEASPGGPPSVQLERLERETARTLEEIHAAIERLRQEREALIGQFRALMRPAFEPIAAGCAPDPAEGSGRPTTPPREPEIPVMWLAGQQLAGMAEQSSPPPAGPEPAASGTGSRLEPTASTEEPTGPPASPVPARMPTRWVAGVAVAAALLVLGLPSHEPSSSTRSLLPRVGETSPARSAPGPAAAARPDPARPAHGHTPREAPLAGPATPGARGSDVEQPLRAAR